MILGETANNLKTTLVDPADTTDGNLRSQPVRALPIKLCAISGLKFDGSCKLVVTTPLLYDSSFWESRS
jgi:hypothetical protein